MGKSLKFKNKEKHIEIKDAVEKNTHKKIPEFKIVEKTRSDIKISDFKDKLEEQTENSTSVNQDKFVSTYRLINEVLKDPQITLFQVMQTLLHVICDSFEAESGSLWITEENKKDITCKVAFGKGHDAIEGFTIPVGKGVVGWVAENNRSSIIFDANSDDRINLHFDKIKEMNAKNLMIAPMSYHGEVLGVFQIVNKKGTDGFTRQEKLVFEDIASLAGMHLKTIRSLRAQSETQNKLLTFKELNEQFSSITDLEKLLSIVLEKAIGLLKAEVGSLWLLEDNGEGIECHTAEGPTKDKVIGLKVKKGMGIVGWVVDNKEPIIVEDCSQDSRFSQSMDKKIGFITKSMITVPLMVKGDCIGALQIINKKADGELFKREDLDLMTLFGSSSAMYIKNAKLFASEKKAKELSALIQISKEISSTLDLDSVLLSIVNLSSQIIPYDRAAISVTKVKDENEFELRAVSENTTIDLNDEKTLEINKLHQALKEMKEDLKISQVEDYEKNPSHLPTVLQYLKKYQIESFWGSILKDDQGVLGLITMEAQQKNLFESQKMELLSILLSQSTVALRNASLYNTIPTGDLLNKVKDSWSNIRNWPKKKLRNYTLGFVSIVLGLIFIKVPFNISSNIEVIPVSKTYYSEFQGNIERVYVKEGTFVKKGDLLLEMDTTEQALEKSKKESQLLKVTGEMYKYKSDDLIAEYKMKEREKESLDFEIHSLERKIENSKLKAEFPGVVASVDLESLVGKPVNFGQDLIKVSHLDEVFVQFEVPEKDASFIQPGFDVKFKVFSYPNKSFDDLKLISVDGEGRPLKEGEKDRFFMAKTKVKITDPDIKLRSGMTGRGKISAEYQPLGYVLLHKVLDFLFLEILF